MGGIAWTEEEDYLLKKCIEQYGEGKWHRVPQLAEESSKSKEKEYVEDQNGEKQGILIQNQNQNVPIIEQSGSIRMENIQMDYQFDQEVVAMADGDGCNKRELWDDWVSEMDLWIDSL
ncbi:Transcription factor MYB-like protein, partial [Cucurbita argyrosperma subsp. argyrosperma]